MNKQTIADGCKAVADALVISTDDEARAANLYHWYRAKPMVDQVVAKLINCGTKSIVDSSALLLSAPRDAAPYWLFRAALTNKIETNPDTGIMEVLEDALQASRKMRIGYHIGSNYRSEPISPVSSESIYAALQRARGRAATGTNPKIGPETGAEGDAETSGDDRWRESGDRAEVLIVIPFRDRGDDPTRTLNLLACLRALRDQEPSVIGSHVVVVETDSYPRHREELTGHADQYLFAEKAGDFNKSWAVNVGVSHASRKSDLICILDADILVDAEFVNRNHRRFSRPGIGSFLPFFDICYLDEISSANAILRRCVQGKPHLDPEVLRGFVVRRPPGGCVWMRSDVFASIRGMDERYEGWGGEDLDLVLRLFCGSALHFFDDPTVHLNHAPSANLIEGERENSHLQFMSWSPDHPIGMIGKFAD